MSAPNPNTVYMMNNLVISLDILQEVTDLTKANKEYAIGKPDAIRPIDLAYGLAQTETTDPNKIDKIFTRIDCFFLGSYLNISFLFIFFMSSIIFFLWFCISV
jgi:hypothetical protein